MSENAHFHPWGLGFKQSGLRHITRVLHGNAINASTTFRAFPPCCFPLPEAYSKLPVKMIKQVCDQRQHAEISAAAWGFE